jgi:hypothetical protein
MQWKNDYIIATVFTIAFTIVTLMNIIGPLHMNAAGRINQEGPLLIYSIIYYVFALVVTWGLYLSLRKSRTELLYFLLIIFGIAMIIVEVFIWGWMGSTP